MACFRRRRDLQRITGVPPVDAVRRESAGSPAEA